MILLFADYNPKSPSGLIKLQNVEFFYKTIRNIETHKYIWYNNECYNSLPKDNDCPKGWEMIYVIHFYKEDKPMELKCDDKNLLIVKGE